MARPTVPDAFKAKTLPLRLTKPEYRGLTAILEISGITIQEQLRMAAKAWIEEKRQELAQAGVEFPSEIKLAEMSDSQFLEYLDGYGKGERLIQKAPPSPAPPPAPSPKVQDDTPITEHRSFAARYKIVLGLLQLNPNTVFTTQDIAKRAPCPVGFVPAIKRKLLEEGHARPVPYGHGRGAIKLAVKLSYDRPIKPVVRANHKLKTGKLGIILKAEVYDRALDAIIKAGPDKKWTASLLGDAVNLSWLARRHTEKVLVEKLIENRVLCRQGDHLKMDE